MNADERKYIKADLAMLKEWRESLTERLKDKDLSGWLRWAIELTIGKINDKIDDINGRY